MRKKTMKEQIKHKKRVIELPVLALIEINR